MLVPLMGTLGVVLFLIGIILKLTNTPELLHAQPAAWWRASMSFLTIGILYALIDIRFVLASK
jgi:hypothetical protein